jgi:DNA-binding LytR/AlgR family response regulator
MIRCIIVDDDKFALNVIDELLRKHGEITVIEKYTNPIEALRGIKKLNPDLVFLDVEMPGLTGIEILKLIPAEIKVILTTASKDYAIEGFENDVLDYIVKPVKFERLIKSINRFTERLNNEIDVVEESSIKNITGDFLYVTENYKTIKIDLNNIYYIESIKEYVNIFTNERKIKTKQRLSFFEESLRIKNFIRIHKSYIVSAKKIDSFSNSEIEINKKHLPIGRNYKQDVQSFFKRAM